MGERRRLPDRRATWRQEIRIGAVRAYFDFGEYEDGSLGEVFIVSQKYGTLVRSLLDSWAIQFSLGLQHGVPLEVAVAPIRGTDFQPNGAATGAEDLRVTAVASILDALAQTIDRVYLAKEKSK